MSDKIGMNHTHIDFHKGTHGYPITNADDMMKPCPLMPDGEWVTIKARAVCTEDNPYGIWDSIEVSNPDKVSHGGGLASASCNSSITTKVGYKFAECRCAIEYVGEACSNIPAQTSYAWRIEAGTNNIQRYYGFYLSSRPLFDLNGNTGYFTSSSKIYVDYYVYVIPTAHQEDGDA